MSKNDNRGHELKIRDYIDEDSLKAILEFAKEPADLDGKLRLFTKYATNTKVNLPGGRVDYRSRIGSFINKLFNSELTLPSTGRRQQIGNAVKYAEVYLREHSEVAIYYAAAMGAAQEYREWMDLVGGLKPEQQIAIMSSETESQ
jgi:hypothetical protein